MRHKHTRRTDSGHTLDEHMEPLRQMVAYNLRIDPDRIRYRNLGHRGRFHTPDPHWQIFYKDEWREFPWTHDGRRGLCWQFMSRRTNNRSLSKRFLAVRDTVCLEYFAVVDEGKRYRSECGHR